MALSWDPYQFGPLDDVTAMETALEGVQQELLHRAGVPASLVHQVHQDVGHPP